MTIASILCLNSCVWRHNKNIATAETPKPSFTSKLKKISFVKLPRLRMPGPWFESDIKVVEAREKDLKILLSGSELAHAYRKKLNGAFWIVGGQVNFKEPDLPTPGLDLEEGLLPPLPQ